MAFFFKMFPEIIYDGRLFIAEPPLYRVNDKKNPFVINTADYIARYVKEASKYYRLAYQKEGEINLEFLTKDQWADFLGATSSYAEEMRLLSEHYKVRDRLLEYILEEFTYIGFNGTNMSIGEAIKRINIQSLIDRITIEFPEIYYDDKRHVICGIVDGKLQLVEISESMVRKCLPMIKIISECGAPRGSALILKDTKTGTEHQLSLLGVLKILQKYQPDILHRFKGLGENEAPDIKTTIMDPNTRTLIRVNIGDIENDMKTFQLLRGGTPADALARKLMMKDFKISKDMIDT